MSELDSLLKPLVQTLREHKFGLEGGGGVEVDVLEVDRLEVRLSDCASGRPLRWILSFNLDRLDIAPEIFGEDDEAFAPSHLELVREKLLVLRHWKLTDATALLQLVIQLQQFHKAKQVEILKSNPELQRYAFEYDTLLSVKEVDADNIQLAIRNNSWGSTVCLQVPLNLDVSKLSCIAPPEDNVSPAVLFVEFNTRGKSSVELRVHAPLQDLIGRMEVPSLDGDVTLMDYVPLIQSNLQRKVNGLVEEMLHRERLWRSLLVLVEGAILDADTTTFSHLSFLLSVEPLQKEAICSINIPQGFPNSSPLLSIYQVRGSGPGMGAVVDTELADSYSYNPRWSCTEMAAKIMSQLVRAVTAAAHQI